MKWSFMLILVSCMHLSAAVYSQQEKMDISVRDVSVEDLIKTIKSSIQVDFLYNLREIEQNGTVSVEMENATVEDILREAFRDKSLTYAYVNGVFIIRPAGVFSSDSIRKMFDIKGKVVDNKKQPLPGVTIRLDGTTVGTAANMDGEFVLRIPQDTGRLIFTFVGFKQKIVPFKAGQDLIVRLEEDVTGLDEVVVRAYGTQNKQEMISSISSLKADDIKELPTASIASLLQGRMTGVNVIQQSGAPGSAAVVAIRGFNSLIVDGASDGQPLYVVDGIPMNSFISPVTGTNTLADLDPAMIESVEVLKDAAAGSIYGSRAGNGVIMITTKKGKAGRSIFSANVSYSVAQVMEYPEQTGGRAERMLRIQWKRNTKNPMYDYMSGSWYPLYPTSYEDVYNTGNGVYDAFWGHGESKISKSAILQDSLNPFYNNQTNWWKYAFKTGEVVNANIQASGGSERFQYMIGAGYYTEQGIMLNSNYSRANLISNMTVRPTDKLKLDTRIYLSYVDRSFNQSSRKYEGITVNPAVQSSLLLAGGKVEDLWLEKMRKTKDRSDNYRLITGLLLEYEFFKGFTLSASGNLDFSQSNLNVFTPSVLDAENHENLSKGAIERSISLSTEELLRYKTSLQEKHNIEVLLGMNINKEQNLYVGGSGRRGASDDVHYYDPGKNIPVYNYGTEDSPSWESTTTYKSDFREKVMVSFFGRLSYNYKQRYLMEVTLRRDGSSTFGENHRWANFPSYAVGWSFSEEPFMQWASSWLDWGKIRGSYGTSGQIFTKEYLAHGLMTSSNSRLFQGVTGVTSEVAVSPDLTWEKTKQYNIGWDMDMFNYRVNLKLDYYYRYTSSLLWEQAVPGDIYPVTSQMKNALEVSNEGLELEVQVDVLRESAVSWRSKLNVSRNWNYFEKSYSGRDVKLSEASSMVIGRPIYGIYVYDDRGGYYQSEKDVPMYYKPNGEKVYFGEVSADSKVSGMVGTRKIKDLNGDGFITSADLYYAGSPLPWAHGGWVNELRWKNFDLNVLFNFSIGRKIINQSALSIFGSGPLMVDLRDVSFWEKEGDVTDFPIMGRTFDMMLRSNIERVHSLSMKQITLGYELPKKWARKVFFSGIRMFVTGENLFYLSNYSGGNPEVIDVYSGLDNGTAYPLPRKWTLGLTLNF